MLAHHSQYLYLSADGGRRNKGIKNANSQIYNDRRIHSLFRGSRMEGLRMITQSQQWIDKVQALAFTIEQRKQLEKAEAQMKKELKEFMGSDALLDAGNFFVTISSRSRKDLDKEALSHDYGPEILIKYSKVTSYEILDVKSKARQEMKNA